MPLNKELAAVLHEYREERGSKAKGPVFTNTNADKGKSLTAGAVAVWFHSFYGERLGWEGYSSHSRQNNKMKRVGEERHRWLRQYNHIRPHHALGMRPPVPETILEKPQISGPD